MLCSIQDLYKMCIFASLKTNILNPHIILDPLNVQRHVKEQEGILPGKKFEIKSIATYCFWSLYSLVFSQGKNTK